jgi:membrane protein required for colicin V production
MTPYDAAMAGVIVAGMVWGAFKGITWQLASILSLVLGYSVAHPLSGQLAPYFPGEPVVARSLAMIAVYVGTSGGVFLVAWLIRATLRKLQFEAFDRHLGMMLGGIEGALLGLIVTLFVVSLAPQTRDPIFGSRTGRVVGLVMNSVGPVLPPEARQVLAPFLSSDGMPAAAAVAGQDVADPSLPSSETATASRTAPRVQAIPSPSARDGDPSATTASFSDLLEESEKRIGKAVIDGAAASLKRSAKGGEGDGTDRAVERR